MSGLALPCGLAGFCNLPLRDSLARKVSQCLNELRILEQDQTSASAVSQLNTGRALGVRTPCVGQVSQVKS